MDATTGKATIMRAGDDPGLDNVDTQTGRSTRRKRRPRLLKMLNERDFQSILDWARSDRRVVETVFAFLYEPDDLVRGRAIDALGRLAGDLAGSEVEFVNNVLRRLTWSLSDESGMINWHAPEAIAEIVCSGPGLFGQHTPIVVNLLTSMAPEDLEHFRPGVLWAIGRLGSLAGEAVGDVLPAITASLDDPDPQVRGLAVWCLIETGKADCLTERSDLLSDSGQVRFYVDGEMRATSVGSMVRDARGMTETG